MEGPAGAKVLRGESEWLFEDPRARVESARDAVPDKGRKGQTRQNPWPTAGLWTSP